MTIAKVTIGVSVYNGSKFILATLDSIAKQTFKNIKVIIIDDCSTDNSIIIINKWLEKKDNRFSVVRNSHNLGISKCASILLSLADTEYFQILGHDDIIYPTKIHDQLTILESTSNDVAMVYSNMNVLDENNNIIQHNYFDWIEFIGIPPTGDVLHRILQANFINASSVLCKANCLKQMNGFNEKFIFEDWQMWIKIAEKFKIKYYEIDAGGYRIVSTSIMHSSKNTLQLANDMFLMYQDLLKEFTREKKIIKKMLTKFAIYNFKLNNINKTEYLYKALSYNFTFKTFLYYLISKFSFK